MPLQISISNSIGGGGGSQGATPTPPSFADTKSFQFDGITDSLTYGTTSLGITTAISVSAWVKIPTTNTGGGGTNIQVIMAEDLTTSGQRNWNLFWRGGGIDSFYFVIHNTNLSSASAQSVGVTPNSGQWIHILATYDGTANANGIKLYIDGVLNAQGTASSTGINSFTSSEPNIGRLTGQNQWNFEGNIDEVSVFSSTALSQSEVLSIFNGGVPDSLTALNPLLWLRMGEEATWNGSKFVLDNQGSLGGTATSVGILPSDPNPTTDVPLFDNKSFTYDGAIDYVDIGNPSSLQITNTLSISTWVKMSSTGGQSQNCIISKDNGSAGRSWTLWGKTSSTPIAYIWNGGTAYSVQAITNIKDDQWHHVVLSYLPSTSLKIYIDGVLEGTNTTSIPSSINNVSQSIQIGRFGNGLFHLIGNINDVSIFNTELTQANVTTIFNGGLPNNISALSPLGWWRAEQVTFDGADWTLIDQGSGGNNGLSSSMPLTARTSDVPLFDNKSFAYDGIADYVDLGDLSALSGVTEISVSLWFNASSTSNMLMLDLKDGTSRIAIQRRDQTKIYLYINGVNGLFPISTVNNTWYNLSYVFNGSGATNSDKLKLYIDGIEVTATSYSSIVPTSVGVLTSSMISNLGGLYDGTFTFSGKVNDTSIFNSELTQANVTEIYNGGIANDISSLNPLGYWRAEEVTWDGSNWTMIDQGSGANNGLTSSMPLTSRTSDVPT